MPKELKTPTTYQEQISIMTSRGIIISDPAKCEDFLSHVNYYRLSGYIYPFLDHTIDKCRTPIDFSVISDLYAFDAAMRSLIFSTIEVIEIYNRNQFSYYSAHSYGADGYMLPEYYNSKHDHQKFLSRINGCIRDNKNAPAVRHHMRVYGGKFPIWVIIDYFSLGMMSYFYSDMLNADKAKLAQNMYSVNYQTLSSWLRCLTDLRNRCAHYSRLFNWKFPSTPRMPQDDNFTPDRSLFTQLYMLKLMYPYPDRWNDSFVNPLDSILCEHNFALVMEHVGIPQNWKTILSR